MFVLYAIPLHAVKTSDAPSCKQPTAQNRKPPFKEMQDINPDGIVITSTNVH